MNKIFFTILFASFLFAATASESLACSCLPLEDVPIEKQVRDAYAQSTSVFVGEVVDVTTNSETFSVAVKFKVEKSWNQKAAKNTTVFTASQDGLCGFKFEIGKKYLVYAKKSNDVLKTDLCTRTASATANKDIAILNKIKKAPTKSAPK